MRSHAVILALGIGLILGIVLGAEASNVLGRTGEAIAANVECYR